MKDDAHDAMAKSAIMHNKRKSGMIFASTISEVPAGDMSSCSSVPASRSLTIVAEATSEPFKIQSRPSTPVTLNQDATRPGL